MLQELNQIIGSMLFTLRFLFAGQIILPHYRKVFTGGFKPLLLASARGILTGKRSALA